MTLARTARRTVAPLLATAVISACGPTPPQPPYHAAKKLAASTGDISTECGLAFQVTAFPGNHQKDLANLESSALHSVRSLASVYARNRAWIYQGESVGAIVLDAVSMLKSCGLNHAATTLERIVSHHRR
jgi:hypothetical protein